MQTFTCENTLESCETTLESHPWFANKFNNIQEHEHIVYMRFTRLGIFYKNTHYFFTGTKTDLNNFMLERKKEIDEAKKEVGFGRGDHDNLWDTPVDTWGFRPPTTNRGFRPPTTNLVDDEFERAPPFGFKDGFERADPFGVEDGFERAEPFEEPLPFSNWNLYLYENEEEFKSALHLLEMQTHKGRTNGFPDEIIYINQANK